MNYTTKFRTENPVNDIIESIRAEMMSFSQMQLAVFHENHVCPVCPVCTNDISTPKDLLHHGGRVDRPFLISGWFWAGVVAFILGIAFWVVFWILLFTHAEKEANMREHFTEERAAE